MSASDPKRTCSALVSLSTLRIFQRVAALIIRLLLLSQNSGQALLRNPKILTGVERSAEIVQSQICLAEQYIRLPALRKRNGVLRLGSQCFAKIIDRLLVVAQGEVQTAAIKSAIGLSGIALYSSRIIRDGIVIVSKFLIGQASVAIGKGKVGLQPDSLGKIGDSVLEAAHVGEHSTAVVPRLDHIGIQSYRDTEVTNRIPPLPCSCVGHTAIDVSDHVGRVAFDDLAQQGDCSKWFSLSHARFRLQEKSFALASIVAESFQWKCIFQTNCRRLCVDDAQAKTRKDAQRSRHQNYAHVLPSDNETQESKTAALCSSEIHSRANSKH